MDQRPGSHDTAISVTVDEADVVRLTWAAGLEIDGTLARQAMQTVDELNGGRQRPLFVGTAGPSVVSRDARRAFTEPSSVSRVALVGRSAVDQMLANFVLRLTSPPVPTRFFTSEPAAMAWLRDDRSAG